ncbi:MAG: Crp/Fnr family transcriptional regulator [Leptolyngbyaceae cyanobacterium MO_188.B28]|nr:Crp/Fnr family transcriptional regulator [Leptolyngbyaceae cyanobacterium MO_188.B28]
MKIFPCNNSSSSHSLRCRQTFNRRALIPTEPHSLWLIKKGTVRTLTWNEEGDTILLGLWRTGDVVGQPLAQVDPYAIQCLTSVVAQPLDVNNSPPRQVLLDHIHQTGELLRILHCKRIDGRLIQFLSWLAEKFGYSVDQGQCIGLQLTHQEIADCIGTTRVTITRLLHQFEEDEIIGWFENQRVLYRPTLRMSHSPHLSQRSTIRC